MTKEQIAELYKSRKTTDYDGIVKQLMSKMQDEKIIQFLGCMFSKNYTKESKITRLCSETHDVDNHKKISDFYIKVDDDFFNIEVQSRSDKTMAMRIFEYGVRGATMHGKTYSDDYSTLDLDMPEPVVIYLRKYKNTPNEFTINLHIPAYEEPVQYKAKVKFVDDYTVKDMIDNKAYPLLPFYPMRYEKAISKDHDSSLEDIINEDRRSLLSQIDELQKQGEVEPGDCIYIKNAIAMVYHNMMIKGNTNMEKVGAIMDQVQTETVEFFDVYDAMERMQKLALEEYGKKIRAKSIAEGRAEGKAEGKAEGRAEGMIEGKVDMALKMMESGVALDIIQKCSGLSDSGMEKLVSQYKKSLETAENTNERGGMKR